MRTKPIVHIIGLGPGGPDLVTRGALDLIESVETQFLRTERHPAAVVMPHAQWFDRLYDTAATTDDVYPAIRDAVVRAALSDSEVLYAVPGSPVVAEHSVQLLLADERVEVRVHPAMSFLDLAWARLGVDPVAVGARLIDGYLFAERLSDLSGSGPVLVAQCDNRFILSDIKLVSDEPLVDSVTVLHHLGLDDEAIFEVPWDDLDRSFEPDHLTSLWLPSVKRTARPGRIRGRRR